MELAAQKAAALDRTNPYYLFLFAEALQRQEKYPSAEEAVTTIIERNLPVGHSGFSRRAWIRWMQGKDMAAIDDWRRAVALAGEADRPMFYYYISLAFHRQGFSVEARKNIDRALEMDPDNSQFAEWKKKIEK
jgi:tetratricopeptide (TPR) repeat protein